MLALVREPHTEIGISGAGSAAILELLKKYFDVQVVSGDTDSVPASSDDEELVDIDRTDWWNENKFRVLTGARLKVGISQRRLAEMINVRPSIISEYEHGKRRISRSVAEKLAKALNTYPEKFLQ